METATANFRANYGRLCVLAAHAIHEGFNRRAVYLATIGANKAQDPYLVAISDQHMRTFRPAAVAGLTVQDLLPIVKEARAVVQGEWGVSIPLCG